MFCFHTRYQSLSDDRIKIFVLFGYLGCLLATCCYPDTNFELLLGTSVIATCYPDLKPRAHQNNDCWLLLATSVITTCYTDVKPGVHQPSDCRLLLATFVIAVC